MNIHIQSVCGLRIHVSFNLHRCTPYGQGDEDHNSGRKLPQINIQTDEDEEDL